MQLQIRTDETPGQTIFKGAGLRAASPGFRGALVPVPGRLAADGQEIPWGLHGLFAHASRTSTRTGPHAPTASLAALPASSVSMVTVGCCATELGTGTRHGTASFCRSLREVGGTSCFAAGGACGNPGAGHDVWPEPAAGDLFYGRKRAEPLCCKRTLATLQRSTTYIYIFLAGQQDK